VKAVTVRASFDAIKDGLKTDKLDYDNMNRLLPLNIYEAALADFNNGYFDNAKTGVTLATHKHGKKENRPNTGEGPSQRVVDSNNPDSVGIYWKQPLPRLWANLYHTWNADFVFEEFINGPIIGAKLWNPQVMCMYQTTPGEYMLNRGIALYGMLMFLGHCSLREVRAAKNDASLNAVEIGKINGREKLLWRDTWAKLQFKWDDEARNIWGAANLRSSQDYNARVEKAKGKPVGHKWAKIMNNYKSLESMARGTFCRDKVKETFNSFVDNAVCWWNKMVD